MRSFRFGAMMRKYNTVYTAVRTAAGSRDADGVWIPGEVQRKQLRGHIQPISERLVQSDGGRYNEEDRMLYTQHAHQTDELVEYRGIQYIVSEGKDREYSDINQYVLKKVVANDTV